MKRHNLHHVVNDTTRGTWDAKTGEARLFAEGSMSTLHVMTSKTEPKDWDTSNSHWKLILKGKSAEREWYAHMWKAV